MASQLTENMMESVSFRKLVDIPSTTHATFGLYRYPAKFIPHVVAYVLKKYTGPKMSVFDPFGGYGTVGAVSKVYGHDCEMWDLNPMLGILYPIATMRPERVDVAGIVGEMKSCTGEFVPDWENHTNWFDAEFLPFLYRVWGYYHSIPNKKAKMLMTIPMIKTTRYFSFDDMQKQKLCRSPISKTRVKSLLESDWKETFFRMLERDVARIQKGLEEYRNMRPKRTKSRIRAGVDVMCEDLKENRDILITSPPYLQSQEYMRQAKHDLFWLGFSERKVRELSGKEIPYRRVEPHPIYSSTYEKCLGHIKEEHIREAFQKYFWCVLGTFERLQERINSRMFLFVGRSSTRGRTIPIDKILHEHLSELRWMHEKTLSDRIVGRQMFSYSVNPASGVRDVRTPVENLVILKRGGGVAERLFQLFKIFAVPVQQYVPVVFQNLYFVF